MSRFSLLAMSALVLLAGTAAWGLGQSQQPHRRAVPCCCTQCDCPDCQGDFCTCAITGNGGCCCASK